MEMASSSFRFRLRTWDAKKDLTVAPCALPLQTGYSVESKGKKQKDRLGKNDPQSAGKTRGERISAGGELKRAWPSSAR
jgi:hypothetical protein